MTVTLFMPTLNERAGVQAVMPRIKREWFDEIIIVDGHSTDGTREWLIEQGYPVQLQKGKTLLEAWWQGLSSATSDAILMFSPDGNSIPELIPQALATLNEGYDMVGVSRYKDQAHSHDDDVMSALGNRFITATVNLLFGSHYTDTLVIYRVFRRDLLDRLALTVESGKECNPKRYGLYELLLCIRCAKKGLRVAEIPGDEPNNIGRKQSRVFGSNIDKIKAALTMFYHILRERFS